MCGIAGIFLFSATAKPDLESKIKKMCLSQIKRGPDDLGFQVFDHLALGCSRLRITGSIERGRQPFTDPWGNVIVFNGEIFDHPHSLLTENYYQDSTDALSLAAVLHHKGLDGLRNVSGMFAAAIYNTHSQELLLIRDAVGEKPLYIKHDRNKIIFASTIKAILEVSGDVSLRPDAIYEYLVFKSVGGHHTFFENIDQLPPGSWMRISPGGKIKTGKWWTFPDPVNSNSASINIENILSASIVKRFNYDGEVGIFLSGGLDSGIVASVCSRVKTKNDCRLLSIGYDIAELEDETQYAIALAHWLGMKHDVISLKKDDIPDLFFQAATITENPIQDPVVLSSIALAKYTSTFTRVVLTGDGSDELWGGYERFDNFDGSILEYLPRTFLFDPEEIGLSGIPPSYLEGIDLPDPGLAPLDQVFRIELANRMRNYHLCRIDKTCMDYGVESRCPFLDIHVLEAGLKLDAKTKRPGGIPKGLLAASFAHLLPRWLVKRKKQPFSLPINQWLNGPLREYAADTLNDPNSFVKSIIDPKNYLEKGSEGNKPGNAAKVWSLLQLEAWYQVFRSKTGNLMQIN